jgi:hypothetical protein
MFWTPWLRSFLYPSPGNPLIKGYTQVFYMIHEGDVPSVQCELRLRWSKSMRNADGPSLILIDFNVPALTPRLNWIESALQLSENIILFSIRGIYTSVIGKEPDEVMLRPKVSRPVCLGVKLHLGPKTTFLLLSNSCGFVGVERPLWWGRSGSSRGTHDHILLSQIRDFPNLDSQVPGFISPRNRVGSELYSLCKDCRENTSSCSRVLIVWRGRCGWPHRKHCFQRFF